MHNQTDNHNILDTSRIGSLLIKLTAPMFFGMVIQNIYQIVDTIFVGRFVGRDALAALAVIMPIQMLVFGFGNMVSVGGASLISRLIGQKDKQTAERALGNSIFFAIAFSLMVTALIVPFTSFWLKLVGTSDGVMPYAMDYLAIIMSGSVFTLCGSVLLSLVRAEGNTRVSMISMIIQSVLNICLDAIFIIALKMGIAGAGLAMVISQGVALVYVLSYYLRGRSYLKIRWRNFLPYWKVVKDIFAIGISQFFKAVVDCLSSMIMIKMIGQFGGDMGLSTFSILIRIMNFASMPSMVLSQAMQPILGFNYGAKRYSQALKAISLPLTTAIVLGIAALLVLVVAPGPIIRLFTQDTLLIEAAIYGSHIMFLGLVVFSIFIVGQMVFPSIGKAMSTFLISVLRPLLLIIPAALILPHLFGIKGVWLIFPVTDTLSCLLVIGFIIPLIKKFRKAAKEETAAPPLDTGAPIR
jgi:putative MATE family efflux protein